MKVEFDIMPNYRILVTLKARLVMCDCVPESFLCLCLKRLELVYDNYRMCYTYEEAVKRHDGNVCNYI